jgi:hypothetical protein
LALAVEIRLQPTRDYASRLTAHALPISPQYVLAADATRRRTIAAAADVDVNVASACALPSTIGFDVDSGAAPGFGAVAPASPDVDIDISAPAARPFLTRPRPRAPIGLFGTATTLFGSGALLRPSPWGAALALIVAALVLNRPRATAVLAAARRATLAAAALPA